MGGGIGYLTRQYGLTIDNLLAVDMVLADGRFVTASAKENADLFWAVRGGGGNFGVVTSFLFKAHPVHTDYAGPMLWPMEDAPEMMRWYRSFIAKAPDDVYGFFAFLTVPPGPPFPEHLHNKKMCGIVWCYTGPIKKAEKVFKPIRQLQGCRRSTWSARFRIRCCRACSMVSIRRACNGIGRPISCARLPRRGHRAASETRGEVADDAVDHAPLPGQRRGEPRQEQRNAVVLPRRDVGRGDRRGRSGPREQGKNLRRGRRSIGARFIHTPLAARTSTS